MTSLRPKHSESEPTTQTPVLVSLTKADKVRVPLGAVSTVICAVVGGVDVLLTKLKLLSYCKQQQQQHNNGHTHPVCAVSSHHEKIKTAVLPDITVLVLKRAVCHSPATANKQPHPPPNASVVLAPLNGLGFCSVLFEVGISLFYIPAAFLVDVVSFLLQLRLHFLKVSL